MNILLVHLNKSIAEKYNAMLCLRCIQIKESVVENIIREFVMR